MLIITCDHIYVCQLMLCDFATFDGVCSTSFSFNKHQYQSSSTSIEVMMCIIFGDNNVVTMSFGKDSMYEPAIKCF